MSAGPGMEPGANAVDIGDGHKIVFAEYEGEAAGVNVFHQKPDGAWCVGWVSFNGSPWGKQFGNKGWEVLQREPLTLSPSIQCRACDDHGFIQNGRWVRA
jgi:hypothetical protein